jgi:TfoX/Sxy family transcriptional regulator of competence genes
MAWIKIPKEHHPIFLDALPGARDVETLPMFGGIAATVNGNIAAGLFGRSAMVRLSAEDQERVLEEGGSLFDPMGRGPTQADKVMLPERVMRDGSLRTWLEKAISFTRTLPPKVKSKKAESTKKSARAGGKSAKTQRSKAPVKEAKIEKATSKKATSKKARSKKAKGRKRA